MYEEFPEQHVKIGVERQNDGDTQADKSPGLYFLGCCVGNVRTRPETAGNTMVGFGPVRMLCGCVSAGDDDDGAVNEGIAR